MRRRLFTLCSAVSLLACVAVCVLWVRSYARADDVHRRRDYLTASTAETRKIRLLSVRGIVRGFIYRDTTPLGPGDREAYVHLENNPFDNRWDVEPWPDDKLLRNDNGRWSRLGFGFGRDQYRVFDTTASSFRAGMPYWFLAALTAVLPTAWLSNERRRQRRTRLGHCPWCGYDLRATPDRCPECGYVPSGDAKAAG